MAPLYRTPPCPGSPCSWVCGLPTVWLRSSSLEKMPTPFPWSVDLCPASELDKQSFPVCPPIRCAVSRIINFVPAFSFCPLETFLLSNRGKSQGHWASSFQPLVVSWLGFLVFTQVVLCRAALRCPVVFSSFQPHGLQSTRLLCPWDSPGKNPAVGCHALLQVIFPTQGLNSSLLHSRQLLYHLSQEGTPPSKLPRFNSWAGN